MRVLVALMTRVPWPGDTKTRLMTHLSGEECADLQRAFLLDLIDLLQTEVQYPACIFFTPQDRAQVLQTLVADRVPLIPQTGSTLGERMAAAIRRGLAQGHAGVLVIGSDLPTLPAELIHEAGERLADHDIVLGPTPDGGYYLIAAKTEHPEIFDNIVWGTQMVLAATMAKIKQLNLKCAVLRPWNDVDTIDDLQLLSKQLTGNMAPAGHRHTRGALNMLAGKHPWLHSSR